MREVLDVEMFVARRLVLSLGFVRRCSVGVSFSAVV